MQTRKRFLRVVPNGFSQTRACRNAGAKFEGMPERIARAFPVKTGHSSNRRSPELPHFREPVQRCLKSRMSIGAGYFPVLCKFRKGGVTASHSVGPPQTSISSCKRSDARMLRYADAPGAPGPGEEVLQTGNHEDGLAKKRSILQRRWVSQGNEIRDPSQANAYTVRIVDPVVFLASSARCASCTCARGKR